MRKMICISIQLLFLIYEFIQAKVEGKDYWLDPFNYIELLDPSLYFTGAIIDISQTEITDQNALMNDI